MVACPFPLTTDSTRSNIIGHYNRDLIIRFCLGCEKHKHGLQWGTPDIWAHEKKRWCALLRRWLQHQLRMKEIACTRGKLHVSVSKTTLA